MELSLGIHFRVIDSSRHPIRSSEQLHEHLDTSHYFREWKCKQTRLRSRDEEGRTVESVGNESHYHLVNSHVATKVTRNRVRSLGSTAHTELIPSSRSSPLPFYVRLCDLTCEKERARRKRSSQRRKVRYCRPLLCAQFVFSSWLGTTWRSFTHVKRDSRSAETRKEKQNSLSFSFSFGFRD